MIRLGLTGSIGMGKSTVAAMFRAEGVPVFDADLAVHHMQARDAELIAEIEARHPGTTGIAGVDRAALAKAVWGDHAALRALERLIHPRVERARRLFLRRHAARRIVVLDVPLLFEKGGWRRVDRITVVSAPAWVQRRRVMARPGMTMARFAHILRLQVPDPEKRRRADHVIDTGIGLNGTRRQVRHLIACLSARAGR
jgi:dephospho-CoA kinase